MFQLAIDNIKFTELAHSTINNAFSKIILQVLVFLFFIFHCYVPFPISEVLHGFFKRNVFLSSLSCSLPPTTFKKKMLIYTHNLHHQTLV